MEAGAVSTGLGAVSTGTDVVPTEVEPTLTVPAGAVTTGVPDVAERRVVAAVPSATAFFMSTKGTIGAACRLPAVASGAPRRGAHCSTHACAMLHNGWAPGQALRELCAGDGAPGVVVPANASVGLIAMSVGVSWRA